MALDLLVFYGSYRTKRMGIRLAQYLIAGLKAQGARAELVDARAIALPMLDRRYMDYESGTAPAAMEQLAQRIRAADGFVFVTGEYNWGVQPGLKNLTDHYLAEWAGRPAAIASYSAGRTAGVRSAYAWHPTLTEMGMAVVPATLAVGGIGDALDEEGRPQGSGGAALDRAFPGFADTLLSWCAVAKERKV